MNAPAEVIATLPAVPSGGGLVAAIAAVMNEVHVVAKRGENEFHRYRYATMGDILKEITPLLGRHGIVIFQSETGRAMFDQDNVIAVQYAFTVVQTSGPRSKLQPRASNGSTAFQTLRDLQEPPYLPAFNGTSIASTQSPEGLRS